MDDKRPVDVSEQFEAQIRRFRPWAIALLVLLGVLFVAPIVMFACGANIRAIVVAAGGLLVAMLLLGRPAIRASTCPACKRFMGREIGSFCPRCGARVRRELR